MHADPIQALSRIEKSGGRLLLLAALVLPACQKEKSHDEQNAPEPSADLCALPRPSFDITPETKGVLFTWVDSEGAFQITEKASDVPKEASGTVRVVLDGESPGGPNHVFVADLTTIAENQKLPLRTISRLEWETIGKTAREKRVAALRPPPTPKGETPAALGVDAIVYGADWCKPCHLAEDYLKKSGAKVVKKDIEEDPGAAKEMRGKLKRAGMHGSSIPVLDIGGTILRGFSTKAIDAALKRAK